MSSLLLVSLLCKFVYGIHESYEDYKPLDLNEDIIFKKLKNNILFDEDKKYSGCFIAIRSLKNNRLVIVFKGSDNYQDWVENLEIIPKKPEVIHEGYEGTLFHRGFYHQYKGIEEKLKNIINSYLEEFRSLEDTLDVSNDPPNENNPNETLETLDQKKIPEIIFTGHSSGGAVCSIAAYMIDYPNMGVVTFGCPKFVNEIGSKWFYDKCKIYCRVSNHEDPVPYLYEFNYYEHVNSIFILFKDGNVYINGEAIDIDRVSILRVVLNCLSGKMSVAEHHQSRYIELVKMNIKFNKKLYKYQKSETNLLSDKSRCLRIRGKCCF